VLYNIATAFFDLFRTAFVWLDLQFLPVYASPPIFDFIISETFFLRPIKLAV